jgi:hypothetical protein
LAPIPSRQISPNSVHIIDKCSSWPPWVAFSLESVPGPRMERPQITQVCAYCIPYYHGRRTEFCPSRSHCKNVRWRLSPGSPETLSNPPVFWGNASIIVLGDAGRVCKVRCINSFILVCESQDTNSPRGGGGEALCREGWDGEFNEQTQSAKFES